MAHQQMNSSKAAPVGKHNRKLVVENFSKGVYHIINEIFNVQIIVTKELPPEDNLYLHCLTDNLNNITLINQLMNDYQCHREQDIYIKYINQLTNANSNAKGESPMFEEMMERAKQEAEAYYMSLLDTLKNENKQLSSQNDYLKALLKENNIQFQ